MKFSENWLRQWLNSPVSVVEWSQMLTLAGLEVEALSPLGAGLENVCVGEVLTTTAHPNADRLNVCQVSIAEGRNIPLTIVCGAANVRPGLKVAVAQIGALLAGDVQIKRSKIRGVESCGMLCSSTELGLGETSPGIMELAKDAVVGMALSEYLGLPDFILDINLTPNRGDCLSVAGLTRELCAIGHWPLTPPALKEPPATIDATLPIHLQATKLCPRYLARVVRNINPLATTPLWLQQRLERSQMRCIHPLVDIMNYVMIELGQPLHAFDLATIDQAIYIRQSNPDETITLLDGQSLTLQKPALVIADAKKILALAGIMGGASSAVSTTTTDIVIESAFFTPEAIRPSLRQLHLQSEAAHRFERGVDPELALRALHRATELVLAISGGAAGPLITATDPQYLPKPIQIGLRAARIERILGIKLSQTQVEELLQRLNLLTVPQPDGWVVTVPSYRFDLHLEIDLIEELARLYGYTNIPSQAMKASLVMQPAPETQLTLTRIRHHFMDSGYHEAINYSFIDPKLARLFDPHNAPLPLSNPLSADLSVMRTTLWPGLLQSALFNLNRQQPNVRLFETGVCFLQQPTGLQQTPQLAGIAIGNASPSQWGLDERNLDFFDLKGDLQNLFALTRQDQFEFAKGIHPALHPGRCAEIRRAGQVIGYMGELHPQLRQLLDLPSPPYLFELQLAALLPAAVPLYAAPSKYPSIRRDLAFVVEDAICYQQIEEAVYSEAGETLQSLQLFDIYTGQGIAPSSKSLALSLIFQLASRTLTDEEVEKATQQVITGLNRRFQATLRE